MNPYGHFDDEAREYVITRPDTPLPWINYLGMEEFFGIISHTAGGYSFFRDAKLRRLTRYRYNSVPLDGNGRFIYLKEGDSVWNPGWKPTRTPLDSFECRHGLGTTKITSRKDGIESSLLFFVPPGETAEVWDVTVSNHSDRVRSLQLFSFVEWCLWDAQEDGANFQRNYSTGQVEVSPDGASIFHVTEYRERRSHYAAFHSCQPVQGFDTRRDKFVGVHEGLEMPTAVAKGACTGSVAYGWQPIAAHQLDLELQPGESRRMIFLLAYLENPAEAKWEAPGVVNKQPFNGLVSRLGTPDQVDAALAKLKETWASLLGAFQVEAPNPHVQRMVNVWNQLQCMTTLNFSRSASYFESGIGRGMGYRDSNQDLLGVVHLQPERSRQRILDLASTQLSDGTCFHQYQPLTKKGNSDIGGGFNDDPLWLPLSVYGYIAETGDASILEEPCPYADDPASKATLMDHLDLSMEYTMRLRGPHGLPLIGHADWNDCLNLNCFSSTPGESFQTAGDVEGSVAESVMIAGLFCAAAKKMEELFLWLGQEEKARHMARCWSEMNDAVNAHGWDGDWFLRAYDAAGQKIGSKECEEGQIFIESQGWCVLGGIGLDDGKARKALDSVASRLATSNGIILQQPPYSEYHLELGEVSSYPPGYKENAGIFTHNNTWIQVAEAMLGKGDKAMEYYLSICPSAKESQIETYRCEPYVYSQMTAGPDAPTPGEAKNSWLTGTAAWSFVAISQAILGIKPTLAGLAIDPCIPRDWKGYKVTRRWRGRTYEIEVSNPKGVSKGVASFLLDGEPQASAVIPADFGGPVVKVKVELG